MDKKEDQNKDHDAEGAEDTESGILVGEGILDAPSFRGDEYLKTAHEIGMRHIGRVFLPPADADEFGAALVVSGSHSVQPFPERKPDHPRFVEGRPVFIEANGFIDYINDFKTVSSRIFADPEKMTIVCVLDYHEIRNLGVEGFVAHLNGAANHLDHIATFMAKPSPEWVKWFGSNENKFDQIEFSEFLEDNATASTIVGDVGHMDLQLVARGLSATSNVTFKSALRDSDNQANITYEEEVNGHVKGNSMSVPTDFRLALQPIAGEDRYPIDAKLRYRIKAGGSLMMWYKMIGVERIVETAFKNAVTRVSEAVDIKPAFGHH